MFDPRLDPRRGDPRRGRVRGHCASTLPARLRHGAADAADRHGPRRRGLARARRPATTRRCSTSRRRGSCAYPREAVVAEKLEAMVVLGDRNSRIKDFFDLHHLASHFEFDRRLWRRPIARDLRARRHTRSRRTSRSALTPRVLARTRRAQRRCGRFARRAGLAVRRAAGRRDCARLGTFLRPCPCDLRECDAATWMRAGPWQPAAGDRGEALSE